MLFLSDGLPPSPKVTAVLNCALMLCSFLPLPGVLLHGLTTEYLSILSNGHIVCFSFEGIMNILVHLFIGWSRYMPGGETVSSEGGFSYLKLERDLQPGFKSVWTNLRPTRSACKNSCHSTCLHLLIFYFKIFARMFGWELTSHCGFNLHFMTTNEREHLFYVYRLFEFLFLENSCWCLLPFFFLMGFVFYLPIHGGILHIIWTKILCWFVSYGVDIFFYMDTFLKKIQVWLILKLLKSPWIHPPFQM